ncbi:MAG: hypothetical protein WC931_05975 [Bacilli bacterium]|jgi:hypothetical protein
METKQLESKIKRVKKLMKEQELNPKDDLLFLRIMTIYLEAQRDQIKELEDK